MKAYIAHKLFTGEKWLQDQAIIIDQGIIRDIISPENLPSSVEAKEFTGCTIAPAFIDLQIYGAYGKLFAVYPEADSLYKLSEYCNQGGAAFCLPAIATNTIETFYKCIDAVRDYWKQGGNSILGLHIEGPWINPVKRGAHIESLIHTPAITEVQDLLQYGRGVIKIITLAPEIAGKEIIKSIIDQGVIVSAGHSNATYRQAMEGFENGITLVTHLYNAMSPLQHRQPGLVGACFDHRSVMASIIPDGHHVDFAAVRIAKQMMQQKLFAITDAVTETDNGYYPHAKAGDKYEAGGILSGSALTMLKAFQNLVNKVGIEPGEALKMCSLYPARAIRMDHELGKIERNYQAKLVVLDPAYQLIQTIL